MSSLTFEGAHVLVLGIGARAAAARQILADTGAILVDRFSSRVTYVVVDRSVSSGNPTLQAARRAAVPVITTAELQRIPGMEGIGAAGRRTVGPIQPPAPAAVASASHVSPPTIVPSGPPLRPAMPPSVIPPQLPPSTVVRNDGLDIAIACLVLTFCTGGLATPFVAAYFAVRQKSASLAVLAAAYFMPTVFILLTVFGGIVDPLAVFITVMTWLGLWAGGSVHAFVMGKQYRQRQNRSEHALPAISHPGNAAALAKVRARRQLRDEARRVVAEDPSMARDLKIGRPDLPRSYNDGGLVDINSVPADVLEQVPGVTEAVAAQIVTHRRDIGPFMDGSDVMFHTSMAPADRERFEEIAVFLT